jgi:hypothetical protein
MGERNGSLVLLEAREHLQKNLLGEVLFGNPTGLMGTDDPDDERMEVFDEVSRSVLIPAAHAVKTANQIERLFVRHRDMAAKSNTP